MIVRILGEGKFEFPESELAKLEALDDMMVKAIESSDEEAFQNALEALIEKVRQDGKPADIENLDPSDLAIPHEGSTLSEVKALLEEGSN